MSNFKTKCINCNISTSLVPLGSNSMSKEAENFKKLEFLGLVRYFPAKIEQTSKNCLKVPFFLRFYFNFGRFWRLLDSDWKVADQTQKFKFLEVFRFFWHAVWPQGRKTSGMKWFWRQVPLCATGEKLFSCKYCKKSFKRYHHLWVQEVKKSTN